MTRWQDIALAPLPRGWSDATQVTLLGPLHGAVQESVVVTFDSVKGPLAGVVEAQCRELARTTTAYAKGARTPKRVGATEGVMQAHRFESGGHALAQLQLFVPRAGGVCTLTFTTTAAAFDERVAEQMIGLVSLE